jgi:hypothetical protein
VRDFLEFFHNFFDLEKFTEAPTFHPIYTKKSEKNSNMFKGGKKNCQAAAIFNDRFCLLLF